MTGRALGGRDHSTINHSMREALALAERDPIYAAKVDALVTMARRWSEANAQELVPKKVEHEIKEQAREERKRRARISVRLVA